jgi:hypothetical protein
MGQVRLYCAHRAVRGDAGGWRTLGNVESSRNYKKLHRLCRGPAQRARKSVLLARLTRGCTRVRVAGVWRAALGPRVQGGFPWGLSQGRR